MSEGNGAEKHVYRIQGLTCTSCAGKFERNVKALEGVSDAKINFGAAKITVYGTTNQKALEQAGAFDNLAIIPERAKMQEHSHVSFWMKYKKLLLSAILIIVGYFSSLLVGENTLISITAYLAAIIIGGFSLFKVGIIQLVRLQFDMKTLMSIAIIGAAIIGEWSEGAIVVILFAISEALEAYSMEKARRSISSLMEIAPKEAVIRRNGVEMAIHVNDIEVGDRMIVRPGQKIAMDGIVISGFSTVNQASITGEAIPVEKKINDEVFAGTLNEEGLIEVIVTKTVEDTTIAKIIHLVEEAQGERAPSQAFVDRFAKYYTPVIILIALLVAVLPPLMFNGNWNEWVYQGLAVLVVGCPCALVVSTPVSIVTAIGNAARNGVLIKGGIYLEEMGSIKAIAFDKTGTLTKGVPAVTDFMILSGIDEKRILAIIGALEYYSKHPLSTAIIEKVEAERVAFKELRVEHFRSITGKGIEGEIEGILYRIGNPSMFERLVKQHMEGIRVLQENGKTVMLAGTETELHAIIAVSDEIRPSSKDVISELHHLGVKETIMLTGDNHGTAHAIGKKVGVTNIQSELLPEEKLLHIKNLRKQYHKVAMVGDGVNDAPALAAATVGIAMGGAGTDTALETADIALMGDDLKRLPFTVKLSRKALMVIKQNIAFSIGVKLLALLLVVPGWLTLWIAIFADMGATLLVTLNSLRLLKIGDGKKN